MSDYADYDAIIEKIRNAQSATDAQYKKISDNSTTPCDINQTMENNNMLVIRNNNGDIVGYDYKYTYPNQPNTSDLEINSNNDKGLYGQATGGGGFTRGGGAGRYPGSYYSTSGDLESGARDSNNNKVNVVSGYIDAAWAAVSAAAKLGKQIAGDAADVIEATGADFELNFGGLTINGDAEGIANAIRVLFGVDDNGNTTMYMDDDTLGALAIAAKDNGIFNDGEKSIETKPTGFPTGSGWNSIQFPLIQVSPTFFNAEFIYSASKHYKGMAFLTGPSRDISGHNSYMQFREVYNIPSDLTVIVWANDGGSYPRFVVATSDSTFDGLLDSVEAKPDSTGAYRSNGGQISRSTYTYDNKTVYYWSGVAQYGRVNSTIYTMSATQSGGYANIAWWCVYGSGWTGGSVLPGVSDQTGATIPVDAITGADPHVVGQNLATQYPQLMGDPIQITVLDDSCNEVTKNYYSVPISYSPININASAPITGGVQINPSFNPDVTLDLPDIDMSKYVNEVINQLYGTGAGRDVVKPDPSGEIDPETGVTNSFLPIIPVIPDTGDGVTPAWYPDDNVGPNIMWQVYNPTPAQLRALGQWLWINGDIVNQLKKIMSNPMDTIFGLHKVYVTPNRGSTTTIVCGNLDSEVSAIAVSNQYVELDCGSVWVTEYFGNIFDYSPYTEISLYLPFIGIVSLSVDDVMRGEMSIKYTVDVYTGACIAEVSINRDGVGGVLYQFNGNAAVEYPITAMSYNNAIMAAVGITTGIGAAVPHVLSSNMIGAGISAVTALSSAMMNQRETAQRSGSFSGNSGAMGCKIPYLIITRPQPEIAYDSDVWSGLGANSTVEIGSLNGFFKARFVALEVDGAFKSELDEITRLLMSGVYK